jgi:hypothetical protein
MGKLKSLFAYAWVLLATPIVLATFMGHDSFSRTLARATGVKVSPWFVGGDVVREIEHGGYRTVLRRPVFDGLFGQRSTGFVQVEWQPAEGLSLPELVKESIDYDGDGTDDFTVSLETVAKRATVASDSPRVLGLERTYDLGRDRAIRVRLRRQ